MPLRDYLSILLKRWWVFLLAGAVGAAAAYGFSKAQQPLYRSSTQIYVMPARPDYGNALFVTTIVRQYSQLVISDKFLRMANDELGLDLPLPLLKERIHTSGTADNQLILIEVDDPNPSQAQAMGKTLAQSFIEDQKVRMENVSRDNRIDVRMYDEPTPGNLEFPKTRVNMVAGAVLGLLLGGIIALFLEFLDDTIKTADDVDRYVVLPVIGTIPTISS